MAAQGGILFQEKVARLVSKRNGKPVLKPNRPLVLKDAVANRKLNKGEATCISEMSLLMSCWKQNNFVDGLCSSEMSSFYSCVKAAQAETKSRSAQGGLQGGRLHPKQVTTLLKRYPTQRTEI
ncbi:small ribosomal subunit protein mS37 [Clinocottus analis]|uniref:small ribosomal subunit protein mS37 n=1 Tax=Clinocottus analis TaxID=304258 RepID=UPI0035C17249